MQECFNIHTPNSVIHHTDKREDKTHMIISLEAEKIDKVTVDDVVRVGKSIAPKTIYFLKGADR